MRHLSTPTKVLVLVAGIAALAGPVLAQRGAGGTMPVLYTQDDLRFLRHMIVHHEQAVVMSALVPSRSQREAFVRFADYVARAQAAEIAQMQSLLDLAEKRGLEVPDQHLHGDPPMAGMLSSAQMDALAKATGAAFERLWLEGMIDHHEGAVTMALDQQRHQLESGHRPYQLDVLVEAILEEQRAEITQMRAWLEEWRLVPREKVSAEQAGGPSGLARWSRSRRLQGGVSPRAQRRAAAISSRSPSMHAGERVLPGGGRAVSSRSRGFRGRTWYDKRAHGTWTGSSPFSWAAATDYGNERRRSPADCVGGRPTGSYPRAVLARRCSHSRPTDRSRDSRSTLMRWRASVLAGLLTFALQPPEATRRLGEIASRLSADDLSQLAQLAGESPWLLIGHRAQFSIDWSVEVFGRPSAAGDGLRRGVMVWAWTDPSFRTDARASDSGEPAAPRQWRTAAMKMSWAQVALPGRAFEDVRDQQDVNRPFRLVGAFGDAELVRLIEFVRSGPSVIGADGPRALTPTLPIAHVEQRRPDGLVEVRLRVDEWRQQVGTFRSAGGDWSLVNAGESID